jgi:hypothetical protein
MVRTVRPNARATPAKPDAEAGERGGQHRAAATPKNQPKRSEKFRACAFCDTHNSSITECFRAQAEFLSNWAPAHVKTSSTGSAVREAGERVRSRKVKIPVGSVSFLLQE